MKDSAAHCDKTIVKTEHNTKDTETHWKNITEREEYQSIEKKPSKTMKQAPNVSCNKDSSKKFNDLKYKPNSTTDKTLKPTKHKIGFQKIYASVVQGTNNFNVSITHKSNNTNAKNQSQTLLNKLKTLTPNN